MFLARLATVLLILSVTLGQRVYWMISGNPLDFFAVGFVVVATMLWFRDGAVLRPKKLYGTVGISTVGPYFTLLLFLPLLGVIVGRYEVTVLYAWMVVAVPLAILSLGRAARLHGLRIDRIAFTLILVQGLYGLGQTLARIGLIPYGVWSPLAGWDASAQLSLGEGYLVISRSTGLFINANSFGFWSLGAILVGAVLLNGWKRILSITLGIFGVIGSQSRTSWVGLGLLFLVFVIVMLRDTKVLRGAFIGTIFLAPIALIGWMSGMFSNFAESRLLERLSSGANVINEGVGADQNLTMRVDSWQEAMHFTFFQYPFGTLGPPQALFNQIIDSQFVFLYLQGGVLLLSAFVLVLFSPVLLARRGVPLAGALGIATALVAITSISMVTDDPAVSSIYWLLAAAAFSKPPRNSINEKTEPFIALSH